MSVQLDSAGSQPLFVVLCKRVAQPRKLLAVLFTDTYSQTTSATTYILLEPACLYAVASMPACA